MMQKLNELFTPKKIFFLLLFSILVLIGHRINFSALVGEPNQFFTLFQFFGPIAGAFLGPLMGAASVLLADLANFIFVGKEFTIVNIMRLTPMLFAAYYFGTAKKRDWIMIAPLLAMLGFMLHPVGQQAWFFALYWLIPVAVKLFAPDRLFFRSLGATFTAHAVGSVLWAYVVPMTAEAWIGLIPVVAFERMMFALGITISYVAMNTLLSRVEHLLPAKIINIDPRYVLSRKFLRLEA